MVDHKVYFSKPSQLNDPYDLQPQLQLLRASTERETREMLRADAERNWARQTPPPTPEKLAGYRLRLTTIDLETFELESMDSVHIRLQDDYWIFSLSTDRSLVRLWDEYADARRGLCIHFRADASSPFGFAQRVIYQNKRPILPVPLGDIPEHTIAELATLTKTAGRWAHEREYRLIRYPDVDYSETGLCFDGQHAHFPASAITGITVGTDMAAEDVRVVLGYADNHQPPLPVYIPRFLDLSATGIDRSPVTD